MLLADAGGMGRGLHCCALKEAESAPLGCPAADLARLCHVAGAAVVLEPHMEATGQTNTLAVVMIL